MATPAKVLVGWVTKTSWSLVFEACTLKVFELGAVTLAVVSLADRV